MSEKKTTDKKGNGFIVIILIIVVAVVAYAVIQNPNDNRGLNGNVSGNQLEITTDNLVASWERNEGNKRHEIFFEQDNGFIYGCFENEQLTPTIITTFGSFAIQDNIISVQYKIDNVSYEEKYYLALTSNELVLSKVEEGTGALAGTYINTSIETSAPVDQVVPSPEAGTQPAVQDDTNNSQEIGSQDSGDNVSNYLSEPWKQAYLDYIDNAILIGYDKFRLIYIDNDEIPELYMHGGFNAIGEVICTYSNAKQKVVDLQVSRRFGCSYIEGEGLIKHSNGSMGVFEDNVYKLSNGRFEKIYSSTWASDTPVESGGYYVDGESVSENQYFASLYSNFDVSREILMHKGAVKYSKFLQQLALK